MLNRLFKSLDVLLREKHSLTAKAHQLEQTERRLIGNLSRTLAGVGYRVVPLSGQAPAAQHPGAKAVGRPVKRLRCPECDRTFAHPLPMARHLKATHHSKNTTKKAARKSGRKKSA
jgi:uncharacterized C2H2 Zn-finger protein